MTTKWTRLVPAILLATALIVATAACRPMSIHKTAASAGFNGSFEISEDGFPVNWLIYAPSTVPDSDFDFTLDTADAKDGATSLRFDIRKCSSEGGWLSPGIDTEIPVEPGKTYRITLWVKNEGCRFRIDVGGVSAFGGELVALANTSDSHADWHKLEYDYHMSDQYETLRFQLNLLSPGTFQVDAVSIQQVGTIIE